MVDRRLTASDVPRGGGRLATGIRRTLPLLAAAIVTAACASGADAEGEQADAVTDTSASSTEIQAVPIEGEGEPDDQPEADVDGDRPTVSVDLSEAVGEVMTETGDGLTGAELEQYLARRYEAYWQAFDIARRAPSANPVTDYPELANLAAGERLESSYAELTDLASSGQAIREPDTPAVPGLDSNSAHRIRIESLEAGVAELVSCLVNDQVRYDVATAEVLSDRVITVQTRTTMAKADGSWKVIRSAATALDDGVAGCWLEGEEAYPL